MWIKLPKPFYEGEGTGTGAAGEGGTPAASPPPGAAAPAPGGNGQAPTQHAPGETPGPDWATMRSTVGDETLRASLERFNSLEDMARAQTQLRQEISDRIRLPGPRASEEDVAKFRQAMGVPDDPSGYGNMSPPEGVQLNEEDIGLLEVMAPIAHKFNVPLSAFEAVTGELLKMQHEMRAGMETAMTAYRQEKEAELRKDWGTEFDKKSELATRISGTLGEDFVGLLRLSGNELAQMLGDGQLGNFPTMVKALAGLGSRMDEDGLHIHSTTQERETAQQELSRLNSEIPPGHPKYTDPQHQARLSALYDKAYGSKPIVGSASRST